MRDALTINNTLPAGNKMWWGELGYFCILIYKIRIACNLKTTMMVEMSDNKRLCSRPMVTFLIVSLPLNLHF